MDVQIQCPWITCCMTQNDVVYMCEISSQPLETTLETNSTSQHKQNGTCVTLHLLTTFETFKLSAALSLSVIKTIGPFYVVNTNVSVSVISPPCGFSVTARKFIITVVIKDCFCLLLFFFSSLIQRWMSPNLLVTHCLCRLISEAYLLRKLKNLCRGAAASLS